MKLNSGHGAAVAHPGLGCADAAMRIVPPPPKHLSAEAQRWWTRIVENWDLDDAAQTLLRQSLESFDGPNEARAILIAKA
jgi:hypothetical protein